LRDAESRRCEEHRGSLFRKSYPVACLMGERESWVVGGRLKKPAGTTPGSLAVAEGGGGKLIKKQKNRSKERKKFWQDG